jgi:hypothetical protein
MVIVPIIPQQANPNEMNQAAISFFLFSHFECQGVVMAEVLDRILDRAALVRKNGKVTALLPRFFAIDWSRC